MSLLYNQLLSYDAPSITYSGNIGVSPTSVLNPIQIGNPNIVSQATNNQSSLTTIGLISYDFAPSGQITGVTSYGLAPSGQITAVTYNDFASSGQITGITSYDLAPTGQIAMEVTSSPGTAILSLQQI
jgi:hypothetical protein